MKVGTSESDLGCCCLHVCVCEDLAIILHAWCLYLASPSPSLSPCLCFCLRMLMSQQNSACVCSRSVWAGVLYFNSSLRPVFVYALCCLSVIYNQRQTQYIWAHACKMSTNPLSLTSWFKCGWALETQICNQALLACIIMQTNRQRRINREKKWCKFY